MNNALNIKDVLEIIFKSTKKNANILAHTYLLKDESIISKWKKNTILPKSSDIDCILEFVSKESTESQRKIMRDELEDLVRKCSIQNEFKEIIFKNDHFSQFLKEILTVSVSDQSKIKGKDGVSEVKEVFHDKPSLNSHSEINARTYRGTMEFDLVVPDSKDPYFTGISNKPDIDINLTPKRRVPQVTELFRRKSVLGVFVAWVFIGTVVLAAANIPGRETVVRDSKVYVNQDENPSLLSRLYTPESGTKAASVPTISMLPSPTPKPVYTPQKSNDTGSKENSRPDTAAKHYNNVTINNNTVNNSVNIQGDNTTIVQGEDMAVIIDNN
jgi:hypothetical protein